MTDEEDLQDVIRDDRHHHSEQREAILAALRESNDHPTAKQLYDVVREEMPGITLATVYRNLHVLDELGLVDELDIWGDASRFDARTDDHLHIRCIKCGRVDDVELEQKHKIQKRAAELTGYTSVTATTTFEGICPDCQKKEQ